MEVFIPDGTIYTAGVGEQRYTVCVCLCLCVWYARICAHTL